MNYYELLGIKSSATEEEIKKAYKVQMKKWHPDINKDEEAVSMSMKINEAKDTLLDPIKRRDYDESLKQKSTNTYNKYSNAKTTTQNNYYEEPQTVTKWEYLRDYMKNKNINIFKRIISLILVLIESFFCFALKWLVIIVSFICFFVSDLIRIVFSFLYPIIGLLVAFVIISVLTKSGLDTNVDTQVRGLIIVGLVFASSFILPLIGNKLLSPKIFEFLYNKLDIFLFKKAVGYK